MDETAVKENIHATHTLAKKGERAIVKVTKPDAFSQRYDIIGAVTAEEKFPLMVLSPSDRADRGVSGVGANIIQEFTQEILAPALEESPQQGFILVMDKSRAHSVPKIEEALQAAGCDKIESIIVMPKETAHKANPLDNALWKDLKKGVRNRLRHSQRTSAQIVKAIEEGWSDIDQPLIDSYYHHCRLYPSDIIDDDM